MTANADQIEYWNEVAGPKWVAQQTKLDRLMAPMTEALLEGAAAHVGARVLDVGCGCGDLALRLAAACGAHGDVLAVDISRPMLSHAGTRPPVAEGSAPITWRLGDATSESFAADRDRIVSRFGVMFFDDPPRAFANIRRAAAPGARFAFLTWRSCKDVGWMQQPLDWVAPVLAAPENTDGEIGPFALADAGNTRALFESVGFRDVTATAVDRMLLMGTTLDEAFEMLTVAGSAARVMRDADEGDRRKAQDLLRAGLSEVAHRDGSVHLAGACWLYTGTA